MKDLSIATTDLGYTDFGTEEVNLGTSDMSCCSVDLRSSDLEVGVRGVGIAKIETKESSEDEGENMVTITLTNNKTHKFVIRNGSSYKLTVKDKEEIASEAVAAAKEIVEKSLENVLRYECAEDPLTRNIYVI